MKGQPTELSQRPNALPIVVLKLQVVLERAGEVTGIVAVFVLPDSFEVQDRDDDLSSIIVGAPPLPRFGSVSELYLSQFRSHPYVGIRLGDTPLLCHSTAFAPVRPMPMKWLVSPLMQKILSPPF